MPVLHETSPRAARGRRAPFPLVPLALLAAVACAGPGSGPPPPEGARPPRGAVTRVPDWVGQPLSWEKIETLGRWLESDAAGADPYWVVEARLELAEGRMTYARQEGTQGPLRLHQARQGFQTVLDDPSATVPQRQRAERGLVASGASPRGSTVPAALPAGVRERASWNARPPVPARLDQAADPWSWITVHHSAMEGLPALDGSLPGSSRRLRDIQSAHMNTEGWGDIGYHFLIDPAGRVFQGRDMVWQGAHSGKLNNPGNIGVCMIGNYEVQRPTRAALAALDRLIEELRERYGISRDHVVPHKKWKSTQCPGQYVLAYLSKYR